MTPKSENITWHDGHVRPSDREKLLGQCGTVVWFTGLSGSGKSTLARAVERQLIADGYAAYVLDGDNLRHGLNRDLGFSPEDRQENIRRVAEVAALMADAGLIVITAFISPYRRDRIAAREAVGEERFIEVYLDVPLQVCEARDPKGLYERARAGAITDFTGISAPYEPPEEHDLRIDTGEAGLQPCADKVLFSIKRNQNKRGSARADSFLVLKPRPCQKSPSTGNIVP